MLLRTVPGASGLRRTCPVCASGRARPAWQEAGLRYVRCSACTTLFSDIDERYYLAEQHNVWHDPELDDSTLAFYGSAREHAHRQFLRRFPVAGSGRLLDVGCGLGFFVERALADGWDAYGCDLSAAWLAHAQTRLGSDRVRIGEPDAAFGPDERFDLITAWDVVEHVFDPVPFLRSLARRLAPRGRIFLRTPNEAWVYPSYGVRRLLGDRVELGPLNHVVYFRAATLTRALAAAGLRTIAWPCMRPPQVSLGNRRAIDHSKGTLVTRLKNAQADTARVLAAGSGGRLVLGSDLDVIAVRPER